ncbi:MAG: glycoside hydrolase family 32 protein [Deinococcales bacterium]
MRPKYHFTATQNWLNDPNGLCFLDGEYHLFFQHNPQGNTPGNIGWGHAVSADLLHWTELEMALPFDGNVMAFSGSVVIDHDNSSGFGANAMVAIYTAHHIQKPLQTQHLAYSNDRGRTWNQYAGNPVLDIQKADFRDPKVFWHTPTQRWVMVLALPDERQVQFYGASNLKNWTLLSTFGPAGQTGGIWEVPDLFELPFEGTSKWVLKVDIGTGAQFGGSGGQCFVGHFDGLAFHAENNAWLDYGKDFYAALSFSNTERPIWLAWMNNWQYAQATPTTPWRGCMSLPRVLGLRRNSTGIVLTQNPIAELEQLRQKTHEVSPSRLEQHSLCLPLGADYFELWLECDLGAAQSLCVRLEGKNGLSEIGYDSLRQELYLDRRQSGQVTFHSEFAGRHFAQLELVEPKLRLRLFFDACTLEVFAQDGEVVLSDLIFPDSKIEAIVLQSTGVVQLEKLMVWT